MLKARLQCRRTVHGDAVGGLGSGRNRQQQKRQKQYSEGRIPAWQPIV
jgi:hypothetical protein